MYAIIYVAFFVHVYEMWDTLKIVRSWIMIKEETVQNVIWVQILNMK